MTKIVGSGGARALVQRAAYRLLMPEPAHWGLFLAFLAILPIAGPIALRNLLLAILVVQSLAWCVARVASGEQTAFRGVIPVWMVLWTVFLLLFPLLAQDRSLAWRELGGQWLESLLAWLVTLVMVRRRPLRDADLRSIAAASAIYPLLYLLLFAWAWLGGFGSSVYIEDISWSDFWGRAIRGAESLAAPSLATVPWGFRGFDPIHANLGAAAAHAFIAAAAWGLVRWRKGLGMPSVGLAILLGWSLMTPVLAYSRASVICLGLALVLTALVMAVLGWRRRISNAAVRTARSGWRAAVIAVAGAACAIGLLAYQAYAKDSRWKTLYDKVVIGFTLSGATDLVCNGIGPAVEAEIRLRLAGMPVATVDEILQGLGGDGGRALVMRAGLELVLEHPLGVDGSRNSYKRLIREKCGKEPAINFVHPHQGWIDIALALGWIGAVLYCGLFLYLLRLACLDLSRAQWTGWGVGLGMLCTFWLLRGFFDSMYREHYLQMQAAMIGLFWMGLRQVRGDAKPAVDPIR